jgi:branched-chain amino acid transport system permease protein
VLILSALITGVATGSMYGLLALGFHVTWAVSRTVNFAQGSSMMLGAVLLYGLAVTHHWPGGVAVVVALGLCGVYGLAVERCVVRPFVVRKSEAWLMATVAVGIVLDNVALFTFGKEPRGMPSPLTRHTVQVLGAGVYPLHLLIPAVGLGIAAALALVTRYTVYGKALLAVVQNPQAARLVGVRVETATSAAYLLSTVFAGVAGILIAPLVTVSAGMGWVFGIKAFAAAILGGLDSAWGVVVAGILFGLTEALITAVLGSTYTNILSFGVVIPALALMPHGLLGRAGAQRV